MHKVIVYTAFLTLSCLSLQAQSTLDTVLRSVERKNKDLQAEMQRIQAARTGFKTGITLYDPQVKMDYMKGYPATAGQQTDVSVVQGFDFPTVYGIKKKIAGLRTIQSGFEEKRGRQEILLEAKITGIQLIYLNKREAILQKRLKDANTFYESYTKKYDLKDATILDLNKAKLQLANIRTDLKMLQAEKTQYLQQLAAYNGGDPIAFADTSYAPITELPVFDTLEQSIEAVDPTLQLLEAQKATAEAEIRLSKALWLPKLEAGYRYQGILGQQFHGGHVGISIPLWENRNRVKYQQQQAGFHESQIEAHRTEHYNTVKELHGKFTQLKESMESYQSDLQQLAGSVFLDKSLQAGQINTLEYFMELTIYYDSQDRYLEIEREFQRTAAMLLKHAL
jgi:cobalt-zinc-cadmium efflux system outer membrane protein